VYLATGDCDGTAARVTRAGGTVVQAPADVGGQGRMAVCQDPVDARFGLWLGRAFVGCQVVNEPGALVRNDLVTPDPEPRQGVLRGGVRHRVLGDRQARWPVS
jgi:uncharacterized protein